jgi:hypothetical protein
VHQSTHTTIADYHLAVAVLLSQIVLSLWLTIYRLSKN